MIYSWTFYRWDFLCNIRCRANSEDEARIVVLRKIKDGSLRVWISTMPDTPVSKLNKDELTVLVTNTNPQCLVDEFMRLEEFMIN